ALVLERRLGEPLFPLETFRVRKDLLAAHQRGRGRPPVSHAARSGDQRYERSSLHRLSAARVTAARLTSRCVSARILRPPTALTSTPRSFARATTFCASGSAGPSTKMTMLVSTGDSSVTPGTAASASASRRAFW